MNTNAYFQLDPPNPNDPTALDAHKWAVLREQAALLDLVDGALRESVPTATKLFGLFGGPVDLAVHATNVRYLVKLSLDRNHITAKEEELARMELEPVANCGLCLHFKGSELRILKTAPGGLPKATSDARSRFYNSNQMQFDFQQRGSKISFPPSLSLILLWGLGTQYEYAGLEIACPRCERADGTVDCFWIARWDSGQSKPLAEDPSSSGGDTDLEEIKPLSDRKPAK